MNGQRRYPNLSSEKLLKPISIASSITFAMLSRKDQHFRINVLIIYALQYEKQRNSSKRSQLAFVIDGPSYPLDDIAP
jgi:hypothetical protein